MKISTKKKYFSNVACVDCLIADTIVECVFIKFVLYSCIDEFGDRNFEITHASKKFNFDSQSDKSFNNLAFWSSLATEN